MKINEFFNQQIDDKLPFDVIDDMCVFMRNDPMFYRKSLFPAVSKMADLHRAGKPVDKHNCLGDVVERALEAYCKKFQVADIPDETFTDNDREQIIDRIYGEEMDQIKKGDYT